MGSAGHDGVWREELRLHSYDVDFTQMVSIETICRLFLEAAWNHAEALGVGFAHLAERQRLWVLVRLLIKMEGYPRWGETVRLITWPRAARSVFALREFELTDSSGKQLGGGSSAWVVLDANTKKPQRIQKLLSGIRTGPEQLAVGAEPSKIESFGGSTVLTTRAHYSDVDLNGHVNSGRYIGWLLDSYSFDFHKTHQAQSVEINYLGETRGGETLSIGAAEQAPGTWQHAIVKSDGTEVCRARMVWGEKRCAG
ncbi:MAG TPA: acyl-ACP thioesterase domain-containing protein [Candidatus Limnocylindrales bacterium]|jgi:acyl-ACP thioesterase|nr:acyl-ACP thioesterase domain-containing protein [Candidatus Limnocylindrales bacterium]